MYIVYHILCILENKMKIVQIISIISITDQSTQFKITKQKQFWARKKKQQITIKTATCIQFSHQSAREKTYYAKLMQSKTKKTQEKNKKQTNTNTA